MDASATLPTHVTYVVIGAGVHGLSTAYHLAEELEARGRSASEVVVLEKQRVGAGASGICCGVVRNFYLSAAMNEIVTRSVEIFDIDPGGFGYHGVGYIAAVPEAQVADLERIAAQHREVGFDSDLVVGAGAAAAHMRAIFPDWKGGGIAALLHERRTGWADPNATLRELAGMARTRGVRILEGVEVQGFDLHDGVVQAVETSAGRIGCDLVVIAPGPWAPSLWRLLDLPEQVSLRRDGVETVHDMFTYWKLREGDYVLHDAEHLATARGAPPPVVHVDHAGPLRSPVDGSVVEAGPWGIYFKPSRRAGVQGGGVPLQITGPVELEPYGPAHPEYGPAGPGFDDYFLAGLAAVLGRFDAPALRWQKDSHGGLGAFTPDNYPVVDFVRPNVYAILDSNHGFKMLALGKLAAEDILGGGAPLDAFRFRRYASGALHPVSAGPYPWT